MTILEETTLDLTNEIFICDFFDSYTYNIYADLMTRGHKVQVFNFENKKALQRLSQMSKKVIVVLGPGPGHPDDYYSELKTFIEDLYRNDSIYIFGICLGHQLLGKYLGAEVVESSSIKHGSSVKIDLSIFGGDKNFAGQRYNSLCLQESEELKRQTQLIYDAKGEIAIMRGEQFLTTQFHPESVGSSYPELIYQQLDEFLL